MRKTIFFVCLCSLNFQIFVFAQTNLVPNGGFEEYGDCPNSISGVKRYGQRDSSLAIWHSPSFGTPDYYNRCASLTVSVPHNAFGYQPALEGKAYAGIILMATSDTTNNNGVYREYLSVRLKKPLKAGQKYCVSFYAAPGEYVQSGKPGYMFATGTVGVYISKEQLLHLDYFSVDLFPVQPQFTISEVMRDTSKWYHVGGVYEAKGEESWLTIGSFTDDVHTRGMHLISAGIEPEVDKYLSYAYIDKVSVFEIYPLELLPVSPYTVCKDRIPVKLRTDIALDTYRWSTGETTSTATIAAPGLYSIEGELDGCTLRDTTSVLAEDKPEVDIVGPDVVFNCKDGALEPVLLKNIVPLEDYLWSTYSFEPEITVIEPRTYRLVSQHVCGTLSAEIRLAGCKTDIYMPNIFAPESNNDNAWFMARFENIIIDRLEVYNNWGNQVYAEDQPIQGWDGRYNGAVCPPGVYLWILWYHDHKDLTVKKMIGDVTLLR
jgi:gliding motility-associated-like protein